MTIQVLEKAFRSAQAYEAADAVHEIDPCMLVIHLAIHIPYMGEYENSPGFVIQIVQRLKQDRSLN